MNAPATLSHLQAIGADLRACCDALDDAESQRNFLRNMHSALPDEITAWHCYAEDRIAMCPQYRALTDEAKRAVTWGICPMGNLVCRVGMPVETQHIEAAAEFLRQCRDAVAEDDDVWETAENARAELLAVLEDRDAEEDALAEWRVRRHERDTSWQSIGVFGD
jgi:hypothetical protein